MGAKVAVARGRFSSTEPSFRDQFKLRFYPSKTAVQAAESLDFLNLFLARERFDICSIKKNRRAVRTRMGWGRKLHLSQSFVWTESYLLFSIFVSINLIERNEHREN